MVLEIMKTEIQTLFAVPTPGKLLSEIQDADFGFRWITTKIVGTTYDAKRERTPDQRIVRKATSRYPATVGMGSVDRRWLHVFENAITPIAQLRADAITRLRGGKYAS